MAQGLEIYDLNGKIVFDSKFDTTCVLGVANTGTTSGSIKNDNLKNGIVWVSIISKLDYDVSSYSHRFFYPTFSFSNNELKWAFDTDYSSLSGYSGANVAVDFIYGVY